MAKRVVVNLHEMRAKAPTPAVVVDFEGNEHAVGALTLDGYLGIVALQERYAALRDAAPGAAGIAALIADIREVIMGAMPAFPVGGLHLDELFMVVNAIQDATNPTGEEGAGEGAAGEAHPHRL